MVRTFWDFSQLLSSSEETRRLVDLAIWNNKHEKNNTFIRGRITEYTTRALCGQQNCHIIKHMWSASLISIIVLSFVKREKNKNGVNSYTGYNQHAFVQYLQPHIVLTIAVFQGGDFFTLLRIFGDIARIAASLAFSSLLC